jgi:UDP-2-acetamido-2-deoxy-ribo-hexuluronate aminotransferase
VRGRYPVAERVAGRVLSLPMHPYLEPEQIERVCNAVKNAVRVAAAP